MKNNPQLFAGAGQADITPELGIQVSGDIGRYRPTEEIRDPLYAKVLVLSDGEQTACLVSCDVISISRKWSDQLRKQIAEYLEMKPGSVILHAKQSHSSPAVGNEIISDDYLLPEEFWWIRGGDDRYNERFMAGVMDAVKTAKSNMRVVRLTATRGFDCRVATNRRYISRDDTGIYQARPGDQNVLCWEGPIDPEVGVALLEDENGHAVAALLHHTCHPCHGYPQRWISPDWPGYWAQKIEERLGHGCVALVLNGACGNLLHGNPLDPDNKGGIEVRGGHLVETTERVLPLLEEIQSTPLMCKQNIIAIPLRKTKPEDIKAARKLLEDNPEPIWKDKSKTAIDWTWMHAHCILDGVRKKEKNPVYEYEVQVLRIGDLAVVGWPGEPFVEAQLEVKTKAPAKFVFLGHMCNDSPGYQPTRKAFKYGGYEVEWTEFDENTLDTVVRETKKLMNDLYQSQD